MGKINRKKFFLTAIYLGAFFLTTLAYAKGALAFTSPRLSNSVKTKIVVSPLPIFPQDVVINEIMWMGSFGRSKDEWIELRNTTLGPIDIGGWKIEKSEGSGGLLVIPEGKIIPPGGYFLISTYPKNRSAVKVNSDWVAPDIHLKDANNGNLVLRNRTDKVIDRAGGKFFWPAGWHGIFLHMSMERNGNPGNGISVSDWHTCADAKCNDTDYWKREGVNFGTPGRKNLSEDDSIREECEKSEEQVLKKTVKDKTFFEEVFSGNSELDPVSLLEDLLKSAGPIEGTSD